MKEAQDEMSRLEERVADLRRLVEDAKAKKAEKLAAIEDL